MGTQQATYGNKPLCLTPLPQLSLDVEGTIWILCKCEGTHQMRLLQCSTHQEINFKLHYIPLLKQSVLGT